MANIDASVGMLTREFEEIIDSTWLRQASSIALAKYESWGIVMCNLRDPSTNIYVSVLAYCRPGLMASDVKERWAESMGSFDSASPVYCVGTDYCTQDIRQVEDVVSHRLKAANRIATHANNI
jgi:hypothetical protein